jgi:hypothetical protein
MQHKQIRFTKIEAQVNHDERFNSFGVNLNVTKVEIEKGDLRIEFSHEVEYKPKTGKIKFIGEMWISGTKTEIDTVFKKWTKDKKVDNELAQDILNIINFNSEANGVLVAKALGMVPPITARRIETEGPQK